jgi:hypothetical protein
VARSPAADAENIPHNRVVAVEPFADLMLEISGSYRLGEGDAQAELERVVRDSWVYLRRCTNNLVVGLQDLAADS